MVGKPVLAVSLIAGQMLSAVWVSAGAGLPQLEALTQAKHLRVTDTVTAWQTQTVRTLSQFLTDMAEMLLIERKKTMSRSPWQQHQAGVAELKNRERLAKQVQRLDDRRYRREHGQSTLVDKLSDFFSAVIGFGIILGIVVFALATIFG